MAVSGLKSLPLSKLFVDGQNETITFECTEANPRGVRVPHTVRQGKGYQRDPFSRQKWMEKHAPVFDPDLCKPIDVSLRANGGAAVMDGGGRALMAAKAGLTSILCRVHEGLGRQDEAKMFAVMDSAAYKLRAIDNYVAYLAGGEEHAVAIAKAALPYQIAPSGPGTLKCVNQLTWMYISGGDEDGYRKGLDLIEATCKAASRGWSGFAENGRTVGRPIDGKFLIGLALFIEAADDRLDEAVLRRVLDKNPMNVIDKALKQIEPIPTGTGYMIAVAKHLARVYNRSFNGASRAKRVNGSAIDNTALLEIVLGNKLTYSALVRQLQQVALADAVEEDEDDE